MNYIKQINVFYSQLEIRPLSPSAISLWHALMHINNKAGWKETFTVAGMVLRLKSGLNESSFKRARSELKKNGCITYIPGRGNQAPSYQLTCLCSTMDHSANGFADGRSDHVMNHTTDHNADHATDQMMAHTSDHFTDHGTDYTADLAAAPLVKQKHKKKHKQNQMKQLQKLLFFTRNRLGPCHH